MSPPATRSGAALERVLACSPFVAGVRDRDPAQFESWIAAGAFEPPSTREAFRQDLARELGAEQDDARTMVALRRFRSRSMARIAFRELAGWADVDETLAALSDVAELCGEAALDSTWRALEQRWGAPRDEDGQPVTAVVLGMGKLGGRELNFSSDIDLILAFSKPGETAGARSASTDEFFEKLAQEFTRKLAARTEDGFVFRVDWMLRPFGASGPPAMHFAAMEEYYQVHGREWERYALVKARPVCGDLDAGRRLLDLLRPFVYRRYLDFNAIGSLRDLKRRIQEDVARRGQENNIKLGAGGIREIEFIAQAFQLMRGGQDARLRDNRLRPVLRYLGEAGHLPVETAAALDAAYVFLRKAENAIQMYADEQTHAVPVADAPRDALRRALDMPDWETLEKRLAAVRDRVQQEFERIFAERKATGESGRFTRAIETLWQGGADEAAAASLLREGGYRREPQVVVHELLALRQSRLVKNLGDTAASRLTALLPLLLEDAAREPDPETVMRRVLQIVQAIAGRSTYLTLLRESDTARAHLVRLCAASPWITDLLAQSPVLLDQLLDPRTLFAPPEKPQMRQELDALLSNCPFGDTEALMNGLRRYRQETMLRVAAADVERALPLVKVSDRLTWLAEVILEKTLELTWAEMRELYGEPLRADGQPAGFAIVAYGKFGGIEMGYGSDIDVVFLHDCDALDSETTGARGTGKRLVNEVWLSRLAQRVVNWLSTQTSAGRVYEVDLELRPDGRRGLMVSSVAAFAEYQQRSAWIWEHQALTRARPVAGSPAILEAFTRIRQEVLCRARDPVRLRQEVASMRGRMRAHREKRRQGLFDVKQGEGGLTDIEFLTQYLVLREAPRHCALVEWPDNWRQTEALVRAGVLEAEEGRVLIEVYRKFRAWLHTRDLQAADGLADAERFAADRQAIVAIWRRHLGPAEPPAA